MITCNKCNKKIKNRDNINVLAFLLVKPVVFCNNCYAARERGYLRHILYVPQKFPINSKPYLLSLIVGSLVTIFLITVIIKQTGMLSIQSLFAILLTLITLWAWILWFIARKKMREVREK